MSGVQLEAYFMGYRYNVVVYKGIETPVYIQSVAGYWLSIFAIYFGYSNLWFIFIALLNSLAAVAIKSQSVSECKGDV